jgi:transposase
MRRWCSLLRPSDAVGLSGTKCWMRNCKLTGKRTHHTNHTHQVQSEFPFLKEVDSFALCNVQLQLEKAFKDHFRNRKQFKLPKFKKKRDKQSYTTNNVLNSIRVDFEKEFVISTKAKGGRKD